MTETRRQRPASYPLDHLNPFTYGMICLFFVVGGLLFDWRFVLVELIILFVLASLTGVLRGFTLTWLKSAVVLTLFVSALQLFLLPGDTIVYQLGFLTVTDFALEQAISIATRILGIFSPIIYFLEAIEMEEFITMMQQSGVSPKVTYVVNAAFNMIPQMRDKLNGISEAQKSRGVETEGNVMTRLKAFFPIIGPVILSSIADVEEKTITLEVRGFSKEGPKTIMHRVPDSKRDQMLRKLLWGLIIILVIVRVISWF